jgi:plastocyanin
MRHRFLWPTAAVATAAALAIVGGSVGTQRASAAPTTLPACNASDLVPQLGDVTINQGVGSYANQKLVRGKETLVRFFLKLPGIVGMTCSGSINVINTTANPTRVTLVSGGTDLAPTIGPYQSYPSGGLQISSSGVSVNSQADPIFLVPASRVNPCDSTPCSTTGLFSRSFKATIWYTRTTGGVTSAPQAITFMSPVIGNFDQLTNDLRLLVIPMGDANLSYSSQFGSAAQQAVQNGMAALSRMLPVRAGVSSDLAATTTPAGIRYTINLAAMLNLRAVPGAYNSNNHFCGSQANFDAIKGQLAHYLQAYNANSANVTHPADRVVGVVDAAISDGSSANCAEGMASTSSTEAWVRAIPDQPASGRNAAVPSMTGSLMAMELLHTFGQELVSAGFVHSPNIQADGTAPDRGYQIASRSWIAKDLTALNFVNTSTAPWNNNTTLLEFLAFERALCNLGGSLLSNCTLPAKVGSPPAAAGTGHFVISATTDGTAGGTNVTNSYFTHDPVLETPCLSTGATYLLRFYTPSGTSDCGLPASAITSEHDEGTQVNATTTLITGAFPAPGAETKVELRKSGVSTALATIPVPQDPPEITSLSNLAPGGGLTQTKTIATPEILPKPDIYFLADTTGSMGPALANVKMNASQILNTVKANSSQPRFGAGDYKDFRSCGEGETAPCFAGDYAFKNAAPIPAADDNGAAALAAIGGDETSGWSASGGGDDPEGQLYALHQLTAENGAQWRSDSSRILVWFGDNPGHDPVCSAISGAAEDVTHGKVTSALVAADVRVIAVTLDTDGPDASGSTGLNGDPAEDGAGDYAAACGASAPSSPNQANNFANATGGVVETAASAEEVSDAILAGLTKLPATVTPEATCDADLTISFDPAEKTVTSGDDVTFTESVEIADSATPGDTLACEITFLINGSVVTLDDGETPDPAFQQTISLTVAEAGAATKATVETTDDDPRAEIFVSCDGLELPSHVAVPGTQVAANIWQFNANADTTNTCADTGGESKTTIFVSDGANQVAGAVGETGTTIHDDRESPTASIYAPEPDYVNPKTKPFALNGQVYDPDDGLLNASWRITGPGISLGDGVPAGDVITGNFADVSPPSGSWPDGDYTVTISGTDIDGNAASASVIVHVREYVFSGFLPPISPLPVVNDGKIKSTIPIKWQLRDPLTGALISDLGVVAAIRVAALPCSTTPTACDVTPTGGTMLRYDTKNNQYVYNWLTPSKVGTYVLSLQLIDGTTYVAYFKLTK